MFRRLWGSQPGRRFQVDDGLLKLRVVRQRVADLEHGEVVHLHALHHVADDILVCLLPRHVLPCLLLRGQSACTDIVGQRFHHLASLEHGHASDVPSGQTEWRSPANFGESLGLGRCWGIRVRASLQGRPCYPLRSFELLYFENPVFS